MSICSKQFYQPLGWLRKFSRVAWHQNRVLKDVLGINQMEREKKGIAIWNTSKVMTVYVIIVCLGNYKCLGMPTVSIIKEK